MVKPLFMMALVTKNIDFIMNCGNKNCFSAYFNL